MQVTITEEHLDKAIELRPKTDICRNCIISLAISSALSKEVFTAKDKVWFVFDDDFIATFPISIHETIMQPFDNGDYDLVRKQLPITFELEMVEENVNN